MGRLVYSMMVSVDGFTARPDGSLDWVRIDEELHHFANELARRSDVFVYGRKMYETMAAWPAIGSDPSTPDWMVQFAEIWTPKPKVVVSTTLDRVDWNSRLVREDPVGEVRRLVEESGAEVDISGPTVARELIRADLVDEYLLMVHPVVLGEGTRYWPSLDHPLDLRLVERREFISGVVALRYRRER